MILECMICNMMRTNCYLYGDDTSKVIVIIDPGGEELAIERRIRNNNYKPIAIILTHGHPDHTCGAPYLREKFEIPVMYHKAEDGQIGIPNAKFIKEPDIIQIGEEELQVLDAPGHTMGGILLASYKNRLVFTGDTLFEGSIGRVDLGGDYSKLMDSIRYKLMRNPMISDDFTIYPGHMYDSTIASEKSNNLFRDEFL